MDTAAFLHQLVGIVGNAHTLTLDELRAGFEVDVTGRYAGRALAVVRPATTEETAAVVRCCLSVGVAIVPQGGNTGLVGGSVPRSDGRPQIILSTRRLTAIENVDTATGELLVQAGVTLAGVHQAARTAGFAFGVDFAARDSATIGGMAATNAGGSLVFRYGAMRSQILGVEAVLPGGMVTRRLMGVRKDNTGYDMASLLAGSEGTLGIITRLRLRLVPIRRRAAVALIGVGGVAEAVALGSAALRSGLPLTAAELILDDGVELVEEALGLRPPIARMPAYVLLEAEDDRDPVAALAGAIGDIAPEAVAVADDETGRRRLWDLRERLPEAVARLGVPVKLDVSVPLDRLAEYEARVRETVRDLQPEARVVIWGHLLDGNLHVNIIGADPADTAIDSSVIGLALAVGGSSSGEHGIGIAKSRWLVQDRGEADVAAMWRIKSALDPAGIMNPGVLFGDRGSIDTSL